MNESNKPKTVYISDDQYINNLVNVNLRKDLHDKEEVCPWCHGTGLVVEDNLYDFANEKYRQNGYYPYNHQTLTFCEHCYNGVIRRCKLCGEIMPRATWKHDCAEQKKIDEKERSDKYIQMLDKAIELPSSSLDNFGMCYYEEYPYGNGYFTYWEDFFDWWYASCENEEKDERPDYVLGTTKCEISISAESIVEDATYDLYEDAANSISDKKMDELQEFLDNWCDSCGVGTTYTDDVKYKIRIPWDKYERDYKE